MSRFTLCGSKPGNSLIWDLPLDFFFPLLRIELLIHLTSTFSLRRLACWTPLPFQTFTLSILPMPWGTSGFSPQLIWLSSPQWLPTYLRIKPWHLNSFTLFSEIFWNGDPVLLKRRVILALRKLATLSQKHTSSVTHPGFDLPSNIIIHINFMLCSQFRYVYVLFLCSSSCLTKVFLP